MFHREQKVVNSLGFTAEAPQGAEEARRCYLFSALPLRLCGESQTVIWNMKLADYFAFLVYLAIFAFPLLSPLPVTDELQEFAICTGQKKLNGYNYGSPIEIHYLKINISPTDWRVLPMQCKNCNYPIFTYSRCCPMCGRTVETENGSSSNTKPPQTRFDFWLAGIRKTVTPSRSRRPAST